MNPPAARPHSHHHFLFPRNRLLTLLIFFTTGCGLLSAAKAVEKTSDEIRKFVREEVKPLVRDEIRPVAEETRRQWPILLGAGVVALGGLGLHVRRWSKAR